MYAYGSNNPITSVDPTGLFDMETIESNLEGMSLDAAFGPDIWGVGRWGLLAVLLDAGIGDTITPLVLDFAGGTGNPLVPAGEWRVEYGNDCSLVFSNGSSGRKSLREFVDTIRRTGAMRSLVSPEWWRPATMALHWYSLNGNLYSDWSEITEVPDLVVETFSLGSLADLLGKSLPIGVGHITDRYGNEYDSVGFEIGPDLNLGVVLEGYATRPAFITSQYQNILSESALKDIIEGPGVTFSITPLFTWDVWNTGSVALFGGFGDNGLGVGVGFSFGMTWNVGKDVRKAWYWIDRLPAYDSSVSE